MTNETKHTPGKWRATPHVRVLTVTWGTSRGRDTYGYTLCTLRENGSIKAKCNGGGYDMRGSVFAEWLEKEYQDTLRARLRHKTNYIYRKGDALRPRKTRNSFYGSTLYADTGEIKLDGGCGFSSIQRIAEACDLQVKLSDTGKKLDVITVTDTRGN